MGLFASLRNAVRWAAVDLGRSDGASAQAVALVDPATGLAVGDGASLPVIDQAGRSGVVNTTNTTAVVGNFRAITLLADTTFSALADTGATGQAITGLVLPAGLTLFGKFTGYTLTSGAVRAYSA